MLDEREQAQFDLEKAKLEFEREKARLDFRKFVLGSVFVAVAVAAIPPSFQLATAVLEYVRNQAQLRIDKQNKDADRLSKQEEFREGYVKDFLSNALNQDIELRIRFAEYFAFVSADSFREGWVQYRDKLIAHRDLIRQTINQMEPEWRQLVDKKGGEDPETERVQRTLAWAYKEVGYVERDRSVESNPRKPDILQHAASAVGSPPPQG